MHSALREIREVRRELPRGARLRRRGDRLRRTAESFVRFEASAGNDQEDLRRSGVHPRGGAEAGRPGGSRNRLCGRSGASESLERQPRVQAGETGPSPRAVELRCPSDEQMGRSSPEGTSVEDRSRSARVWPGIHFEIRQPHGRWRADYWAGD